MRLQNSHGDENFPIFDNFIQGKPVAVNCIDTNSVFSLQLFGESFGPFPDGFLTT